MNEKSEIKNLLEKFSLAYKEQDIDKINEFMKEFYSQDEDSLIIGTAYKEWMKGTEGAKELFLADWNDPGYWDFDYKEARIKIQDNVSWISMTGKLKMELLPEAIYQGMLAEIKNSIDDTDLNSDERMWQIIKFAEFYLKETKMGNKYNFPFRFTAVLCKQNNKWLFQQMHFSFPAKLPNVFRIYE